MKVITLDKRSQSTALKSAVFVLQKGGTVVYPTETAYALGADALNATAVEHVFALKGRAKNKALTWIVADMAMVKRYCEVGRGAQKLMDVFWPGALTIVLPVKTAWRKRIPLLGQSGTIAVRVSSNAFARVLSGKVQRPIIATSANRSGKGTTRSAQRIRSTWKQGMAPDLFIDAGAIHGRAVSTIIIETASGWGILRKGIIGKRQLGKYVKMNK